MKYFGYKLVLLSTLDGIPIAYDLVCANTDERTAVDSSFQFSTFASTRSPNTVRFLQYELRQILIINFLIKHL